MAAQIPRLARRATPAVQRAIERVVREHAERELQAPTAQALSPVIATDHLPRQIIEGQALMIFAPDTRDVTYPDAVAQPVELNVLESEVSNNN